MLIPLSTNSCLSTYRYARLLLLIESYRMIVKEDIKKPFRTLLSSILLMKNIESNHQIFLDEVIVK